MTSKAKEIPGKAKEIPGHAPETAGSDADEVKPERIRFAPEEEAVGTFIPFFDTPTQSTTHLGTFGGIQRAKAAGQQSFWIKEVPRGYSRI
jgi:hypothetical protein